MNNTTIDYIMESVWDVNMSSVTIHNLLVDTTSFKDNISFFQAVATVYSCVLITVIICLYLPLFVIIGHMDKYKIKPIHMLILHQGSVDVLAAVVYLPVLIMVLHHGETAACDKSCTTLVTIEKIQISASMWSILLISVDKYMNNVKCDSYKQMINKTKILLCIISVWILAGIFGLFAYFLSNNSQHITGECICHLSDKVFGFLNLSYSASFIVMCFVITMVIVSMVNSIQITMPCVTKHHSVQSVEVTNVSSSRQSLVQGMDIEPFNTMQSLNHDVSKEMDLFKTFRLNMVILITFIVLTFPYFIIIIVISTGHWEPHTHPYYLHVISVLLYHTNTACNPVLFGYSRKPIRSKIRYFIESKCSFMARDLRPVRLDS